jgi:hypothetical protein
MVFPYNAPCISAPNENSLPLEFCAQFFFAWIGKMAFGPVSHWQNYSWLPIHFVHRFSSVDASLNFHVSLAAPDWPHMPLAMTNRMHNSEIFHGIVAAPSSRYGVMVKFHEGVKDCIAAYLTNPIVPRPNFHPPR